MTLKKYTATFFLMIYMLLPAQDGSTIYPFLNIPVSARQAALGGDAISVRDYDLAFTTVNPSLLNLDMEERISVNYAAYLADSNYGTISYARDLGYGHLLSVNARYMDYGKMPRTDESSEILGEFGASDAAFGVGYAYQFEDEWTVGGAVNLVTSKIDNYTSMAVAGTGAITYHRKKRKETVSLVARNFGYQFKTYNGTRERLPLRIDLGYSKILEEFPIAVTVTAHDLQKFDISQEYNINGQETTFFGKVFDHFSFGAELFPEENFNIRLGYNVKRGGELAVLDQRSFSGLSAGFGVKISSFRFDYAHVRYHNASNVNMIGLSMDLIELGGRRR